MINYCNKCGSIVNIEASLCCPSCGNIFELEKITGETIDDYPPLIDDDIFDDDPDYDYDYF